MDIITVDYGHIAVAKSPSGNRVKVTMQCDTVWSSEGDTDPPVELTLTKEQVAELVRALTA